MKVGIITFHFPYNCGATLQCLALQTKLEQLGNEVSVINYRPWYHQNRYVALKNPFYYSGKMMKKKDENDPIYRRLIRCADGFARVILSWRNYGKFLPREKKFRTFIRRNLHETRVYRSIGQLRAAPPEEDVYICGSDQLWNTKLTEGVFDPAYFLAFGDERVRRMSYAVGADFTGVENAQEQLKAFLEGFETVSLREEKCMPQIRAAISPNASSRIDLDPTFLLESSEYLPLLPQEALETQPFILTYTMPNESQPRVYNAARILSERTGLKVIDVCGNPAQANKKIQDNRVCGPDEFLWYMQHAAYVLTNSFHGTAFSVIFRKQFAVIPHTITGNRVLELLARLGLTDCCHQSGEEAAKGIETPVDYTVCERELPRLRQQSVDYLLACTTSSEHAAV